MTKKISVILLLSTLLAFASGPVSYYGRMIASGNKLVGEKTNTPVQARGISLFWSCLTWEGAKFYTTEAVDAIVDGFKSEVVRIAMAADDNGSGQWACGDYQSRKQETLNMVRTVADKAIERDIYVVIDWHSHKAHQQQAQVIDFFVNEMKDYHNVPHVIFEIYNEPTNVQWSTLRSYSNAVISAIRNAGANNLVLVGTRNWAQEVDECANDPVEDNNIACVLHFYAASHPLSGWTAGFWNTKTFQQAAETTLSKNKPIFVSEYGMVNADGGGTPHVANTDAWHAFMDEHKISSCIWAFNNKNEGASIFVPTFNPPATGNNPAWTNTSNLTANGQYILNKLTAYAATAEWRNTTSILQPPPYGRDLLRPLSEAAGRIQYAPTYYNLKGTSLGTHKPATPGVYIEKHGTQIRKIMIKQ
ncbi:MAG: glycoside hydrolase family 5 protein [Fibromonadaceae bacterium]|jgi:endoglucanase|nr:glycoside hydrolase family 5 protein [Fibromonadaceae bacterium]